MDARLGLLEGSLEAGEACHAWLLDALQAALLYNAPLSSSLQRVGLATGGIGRAQERGEQCRQRGAIAVPEEEPAVLLEASKTLECRSGKGQVFVHKSEVLRVGCAG